MESAHGIPSNLLMGGQIPIGKMGPSDVFAIVLGMDLWAKRGMSLTKDDLHRTIKGNMMVWRRLSPTWAVHAGLWTEAQMGT
jgi:hypothetical protein